MLGGFVRIGCFLGADSTRSLSAGLVKIPNLGLAVGAQLRSTGTPSEETVVTIKLGSAGFFMRSLDPRDYIRAYTKRRIVLYCRNELGCIH